MNTGKILSATAVFLVVALLPLSSMAKDYVVKKPPESLDKFYPPKSEKPEWIQQMHKISGHFGGAFVDVGEEDWENAEKHADQLVEAYKKASEMVPEWKDYFDHEAVKAFAEAMKTRDPAKIGKSARAVGATCGKCHTENYVAVWTRYHWPSLKSVKITDPIIEKEVKYRNYMHILSSTFKGVTVNFGEGQYDRALKAAGRLKKRLIELRSTCSKCHVTDTVKQFFVGEPVIQAVDALKTELAADKPNAGNFWKNVGIIGKQACKMCHLTHRPYAIIQGVWEEEEEEKK